MIYHVHAALCELREAHAAPRRRVSGGLTARRIVASYERPMRRAWLRAVAATVRGIDSAKLTRALDRDDVDAAVAAVPWDEIGTPLVREGLLGEFEKAYVRAGSLTKQGIARIGRKAGRGDARFSIVDDRVVDYLRTHGAELVTDFGLQNRDALRVAVTELRTAGVPAVEAAKTIRAHVGLTEGFTRAVQNRLASLTADGVSLDRALAQASSYAEELRDLRALNIARTEAQRAYGNAAVQAIQQSADDGLLDTEKATKTWSTARDEVVRESHAELEGETIAWDAQFEVDGEMVDGPPAGVNCRCSLDVNPLG